MSDVDKRIHALARELHENDKKHAELSKRLKDDKKSRKVAKQQHKRLINALIDAGFEKHYQEKKARKYKKWAGKQDEKKKKQAFKAHKAEEKAAFKKRVKSLRREEKERRAKVKAAKK